MYQYNNGLPPRAPSLLDGIFGPRSKVLASPRAPDILLSYPLTRGDMVVFRRLSSRYHSIVVSILCACVSMLCVTDVCMRVLGKREGERDGEGERER